jgi:hypothetical protein
MVVAYFKKLLQHLHGEKPQSTSFSSCPLVLVAGDQCVTSAFKTEPCQMLKIVQCFGICYSCHLQGECVVAGHVWKPYIGQAVDGE